MVTAPVGYRRPFSLSFELVDSGIEMN
jgi:hypothetical protein